MRYVLLFMNHIWSNTADGSEIRRAPVPLGNNIPSFTKFFLHPRWLGMGFLNYQQYESKNQPIGIIFQQASNIQKDHPATSGQPPLTWKFQTGIN